MKLPQRMYKGIQYIVWVYMREGYISNHYPVVDGKGNKSYAIEVTEDPEKALLFTSMKGIETVHEQFPSEIFDVLEVHYRYVVNPKAKTLWKLTMKVEPKDEKETATLCSI